MLAELFQRIGSRKVQKAVDTWAPYRELIGKLVSGATVDESEAELIIAAAGKSESQVRADVDLLQRRMEWAGQIAAGKSAPADRLAAEQRIQQLDAEVAAVQARVRPLIDAAVEARAAAELREHIAFSAVQRLVESVQSPELLEAFRRNQQARRELSERERAIRDESPTIEQQVVSWQKVKADKEKSLNQHRGDKDVYNRIRDERLAAIAKLESLEADRQAREAELGRIRREFARLETESQALRTKALEA